MLELHLQCWNLLHNIAALQANASETCLLMHFSWDETEKGLRAVPRNPKGHARVRYRIVLANYSIIKAMI
jgi:hypothetical protein